jgi:hypothetical protein
LVDRVVLWERSARAVMAAQLADLAAFEAAQRTADREARLGPVLAGRTVGPQVGSMLGMSATAGGGRVLFACTVVRELTALWEVAADGLVSEWHLRVVVAATAELSAELKQRVARQLAALIRDRHSRGVAELSAHQLGQAATRMVIAIDPEAATRRFTAARRTREVSVTSKIDGSAALWVRGPAEQTQHMYDEVERDALARRHDGDPRAIAAIMFEQIYETLTGYRPAPGPDPIPRPHDDPAAPAQVDPAPAGDDRAAGTVGAPAGAGRAGAPAQAGRPRETGSGLAADDPAADDPAFDTFCDPNPDGGGRDDGGGRGRPPLVPRQRRVEAQVVLAATTMLGLDEQPALLRGYGAIPAEIARRIADTSAGEDPSRVLVRRLFCDPLDGRLLSMETTARRFTAPLRQFAIFRDQSCRLTSGRIRDLDHIHPAADGGTTTAGNAQSLAKNPHVIKDHPGVQVRLKVPPTGPSSCRRRDAEDPDGPGSDDGRQPTSPSSPGGGGGRAPRNTGARSSTHGGHNRGPARPDPGRTNQSTGGANGPPGRSAKRAVDDHLAQLRVKAPDVEWTFPTGHLHLSEPQPALGHGSIPPPPDSVLELALSDVAEGATSVRERRHE